MKRFLMRTTLLIFTLSYASLVSASEYVGSESCFKCHPKIYNDFRVSGHPYKIQKAEFAKQRQLPLPEGYSWDDISYVIGGATKKARYMDKKGYIITKTGPNKDIPGKNQYNLATGAWSDYEAGKEKKYDCGPCHMTAYKKEGQQGGLEGIIGTWALDGIQCEECHGPGSEHIKSGDKAKISIDRTAAGCGKCHIRGDKEKIPAKGGFIEHHEQYNELLASPHNKMECVACHNPHKKAEFSIKINCESCHDAQAKAFKDSIMEQVGVKCVDCHMPKATKSAVAQGKYEGDVRTHLFRINTAPDADMFYTEEVKGEKKTFAKNFVTIDFACLSCHKNKDRKWASSYSKGIHSKGK